MERAGDEAANYLVTRLPLSLWEDPKPVPLEVSPCFYLFPHASEPKVPSTLQQCHGLETKPLASGSGGPSSEPWHLLLPQPQRAAETLSLTPQSGDVAR